MTETTLYRFEPDTGVFVGAEPAPVRNGQVMLPPPGHASLTTEAPPELTGDDQAPVWDKDAQEWGTDIDKRGTAIWHKVTRIKDVHTDLGPIPDTHTKAEPPEGKPYIYFDVSENCWRQDQAKVDEAAAEEERQQSFKDDAEAKELIELLRSKTNDQIDNIVLNASDNKLRKIVASLCKILAMQNPQIPQDIPGLPEPE